MEVKVKFNDINVKEEKEKTLVKILMLKGEKGDTVSAEWGTITGNVTDQTDLKNALDSKANQSDLNTTNQNVSNLQTSVNSKANQSDLNTTNQNVSNLQLKNDLKPYYFDTINDLKNADLKEGDCAITLGYYEVNDGGSGIYNIVDDNTLVDDGGSIIDVANQLKAVLLIKDFINIKQFGARPSNTDDTTKIQNAINYAKNKYVHIYIPEGTYKVSQIVFDYQHAYLYGESKKSALRSINNNSQNAIVVFSERGIINSVIKNLYIHGNKENNSNIIDGILFTSENEYGDSYALIDNVEVVSCTGNGFNFNGSKIREIRLSNTRSAWNKKNGYRIYEITDSMFYNNTAASNEECGYYIKGNNHKITSCKAHHNGFGDFETIDYERAPASAYEETSDTEYNPSKLYFIRNGTQYNDNPYTFSLFTGDSFESGVIYYECTKNYYKRYPGFYLEGKQNSVVNCEAQDNSGDGIYVNGGNNNIDAVICDNNGRMPESEQNPIRTVSYASVNLEQIYDGVHLEPYGNNNVSGVFADFRYDTIGYSQRSSLCISSTTGKCNANIECTDQKNKVLLYNQASNNRNHIVVDGENFYDEYDISRITMLTNYSLYSATNNYSYLKKYGVRKYLKFIVAKSSNYVTTDDIVLCTLPEGYRPQNTVTILGKMSSAKGYNIRGTANIIINANGEVQFRGSSIASPDLIIECDYE